MYICTYIIHIVILYTLYTSVHYIYIYIYICTQQLCAACRDSKHMGSTPEGNFGGNLLLDGSISLSPLCAVLTKDLHVTY